MLKRSWFFVLLLIAVPAFAALGKALAGFAQQAVSK
jgi:hypothetical protein